MHEQLSRLILALYRGCREQPVADFQDWAFEQVKSVLPFDSALWLTGVLHSDGNATFHTRHLYRQPLQLLFDWAATQKREMFTQEVFATPSITCNCVTSLDMGPEMAQHARRYRIEHILATTQIDPVASLSELISIYRADLGKPFSEEERLFQQALVPHLAETWRLNRMLALTYVAQPVCVAISRSAAADGKGVLHLIDSGFTRLLQEEWPDWHGPRLPDELFALIESRHQRFIGKTIVVGLSELDELFLLRGRKKARLDTLTQREREVAMHFAAGRNHKEIARNLAIAPATARNHIASIHAKLGSSKGTQVAAMLLRDGCDFFIETEGSMRCAHATPIGLIANLD